MLADFFKEYECGLIDDAGFVAAIKDRFQQNVTDGQVIAAWNALLLDFPPSRIEFLKSISSKYRLFLFSNTNALHREAFNIIYQNTFKNGHLDELFEKAYYSHILKMRKPEPSSYQFIIDENELLPAETLFIDDALVNIEGAQKMRHSNLSPGGSNVYREYWVIAVNLRILVLYLLEFNVIAAFRNAPGIGVLVRGSRSIGMCIHLILHTLLSFLELFAHLAGGTGYRNNKIKYYFV